MDFELIGRVGERHQDEAFSAPYDGPTEFTDTDVRPGQTYQYVVTHLGPENTESGASSEVFVQVPGDPDGAGPDITIVGPTDQDWWSYPRVVAHFADDTGIDPDTVTVSFDADLGNPAADGRAAGSDVSDLAYRIDAGTVIVALEPPLTLPNNTLVEVTVAAEDLDGNVGQATEQFFVSPVSAQLPSADFTASTLAGDAPLMVDFDATGSTDPDGKLYRYEWYFGDGTTSIGRQVSHEFLSGGDFEVRLVVRDNDGGVDSLTETVEVAGDPAPCTVGEVEDCYGGPEGTEDEGSCLGGTRQCQPGGWGECVGEVLPEGEDCENDVDDDCDGFTDDEDEDCGRPGGIGGDDDDDDDSVDDTAGDDGNSAGGSDGDDDDDDDDDDDAGTGGTGETEGGEAGADSDGGCACSTRGAGGTAWWLLMAPLLWRRRATSPFAGARRRRSAAR